MLRRKQFDVLKTIAEMDDDLVSQRKISARTNISLGSANKIFKELTELGYIDGKGVTEKGLEKLNDYKVDNAIIMAAGMSTRFAPLSYETPKGLLLVKNEILIERQIEQLLDAGIEDITVVVGYKKERFFYLEEKYGVKIIVNEDYYRYNNTSTLIRVLDKLKNTYICSSDNYYVENVFNKYEYQAYYSAVYYPGISDEWGLEVDSKGRIKKVIHNPQDSWCMLGHVFFSQAFSDKFKEILTKEYEKERIKESLWETVFEEHIPELEMCIRRYEDDVIKEFDSLDELRKFDSRYIHETGSATIRNICKVLECKEADVQDIKVIKNGMTNLSFKFSVAGKSYVYKEPEESTKGRHNYDNEAKAIRLLQEHSIDTTCIYTDSANGWRISNYIGDTMPLDINDRSAVSQALGTIRKVHHISADGVKESSIRKQLQEFEESVFQKRKDEWGDYVVLKNNIEKLFPIVDANKVLCLCHGDFHKDNILIKEGDLFLIDWEYVGLADPASDIGTFVCCSDYSEEEIDEIISTYLEHEPSKKELIHYYAYIAIMAFYWYMWGIYKESNGHYMGKSMLDWYRKAKRYYVKTEELIQGEK